MLAAWIPHTRSFSFLLSRSPPPLPALQEENVGRGAQSTCLQAAPHSGGLCNVCLFPPAREHDVLRRERAGPSQPWVFISCIFWVEGDANSISSFPSKPAPLTVPNEAALYPPPLPDQHTSRWSSAPNQPPCGGQARHCWPRTPAQRKWSTEKTSFHH